MLKFSLFLFLLALPGTGVHAQIPDTDSLWIEAGNLRICLRADGSLYSGTPGGAVQYRHTTADGAAHWVKVLQDAGLWFAGLDPAGNLLLSVQKFEPRATDFQAGIAGVPGSGKIWSVTYDQIAQHVADYSDNAVIDHPIEAIFAWPGRGNRFFKQYNGFEWPDTYLTGSSFWDRNLNYQYEPDKGDIPYYIDIGAPFFPVLPEQIHCFAFHSNTASMFTNLWAKTFPLQGFGQLFTFSCKESPVFENAYFMSLLWTNTSNILLDSCMVGLYANPDIGNPTDDFHGSKFDSYFAYNADLEDDGGFEENPPLLMISAISPPVNNAGYSAPSSLMPIWPSSNIVPPALKSPIQAFEYYNYLTGYWRDGTPLTVGGIGYDLTNSNTTKQAFYGNPYKPGNWSEVHANNQPGDRRGILSWNTQSLKPGQMNKLMFMTSVFPGDTLKTPEDWFENVFDDDYLIKEAFTYEHAFPARHCANWPPFTFPRYLIRTYPNPVSDLLHIQVEGGKPTLIRLYDAYQRVVEEITFPDSAAWWNNPLQLPVRHLPPGVYYLEAGSEESIRTVVQKVIVLHGTHCPPAHQQTSKPIHQSTSQPINQSTNKPIHQSTSKPVNQ